jgi:hypothetical protein
MIVMSASPGMGLVLLIIDIGVSYIGSDSDLTIDIVMSASRDGIGATAWCQKQLP